MPASDDVKSRREALPASRLSGVARISYDGKTMEYRSLAEIDTGGMPMATTSIRPSAASRRRGPVQAS
ncbi:MAG: hypothetical protein GDA49_10505 [Rhodospirillales bacterium]|nr:hypothetical protein [Rhodospirillales bacterium]